MSREQTRRDALYEIREGEPAKGRDWPETVVALLAELNELERGWSEDDKEWREKLDEAKRERDEARHRLHLILSEIGSMHGYLDADGEIDTAAKFRAIERLARWDWDVDGMSRVV